MNTPAVSNLIREGKTFLIPSIIQTERRKGMILMDDSLKELAEKNIISEEEALRRTETRNLTEATDILKPEMRTHKMMQNS